ncbi:DUF4861 domain-containing protein [Weeksellaceae bacterium TAE3-ERU29]|nr:DUF4861 domain-containing protein [Weeksellaceae bacterium TAE3-ERU29]
MKKKLFYFVLGFILLTACEKKTDPVIEVKNTLEIDRNNEMVEVNIKELPDFYRDKNTIIVVDSAGTEIPFQFTYDDKLIFLASIPANSVSKFTIKKGTPQKFPNKAQGRQYPERLDDMAWENDVMGFRAYGPSLQQTGETSYGYDLFPKRGTDLPVLDTLYAKETDEETRKLSNELKETDPERSLKLWQSISYHYDRGYGLDCYSVGPTLGSGVTALMKGDTIVYPYCYKDYKILDNGPLRFTVKLTFTPLVYDNEEVIEQRVISLDVGSQLNKTKITYDGLTKESLLGTGIVLHDSIQRINIAPNKRYMSYIDPTNTPDKSNGEIFVGAVFPKSAKEMKTLPFDEEKIKAIKAYGHLLAINTYVPNEPFVYYWGAGWTKGSIPTEKDWITYLQNFEKSIDNPLQVTVVK